MFPYPKVQYKGQISTHSEDRSDQHYKNMKLCWRQSRTLLSLLEDTSRLVGRMKLLAFCGFLFVFLLCLSAFAAEGTVYFSKTTVPFLLLCFPLVTLKKKKKCSFSNCLLILEETELTNWGGKDNKFREEFSIAKCLCLLCMVAFSLLPVAHCAEFSTFICVLKPTPCLWP